MKLPPRCHLHPAFAAGCDRCQARHAAYERLRRRLIAAGQWDTDVPAEPVREHLAAIVTGYGATAAAERASGVDDATIRHILRGRVTAVRAVNAEALLSLTVADVDRHRTVALVDGCGSRRRLQAAQRQGWPLEQIAAHLGRRYRTVQGWLTADKVSEQTADLIRTRIGHDLALREGPSRRIADRSRRAGYVPLWAWEDVDDPAARPRPVTVRRPRRRPRTELDERNVRAACAGELPAAKLTKAERTEALRRLAEHERLTAREMAARLRWGDGDERGAECVRAYMSRAGIRAGHSIGRRKVAV